MEMETALIVTGIVVVFAVFGIVLASVDFYSRGAEAPESRPAGNETRPRRDFADERKAA